MARIGRGFMQMLYTISEDVHLPICQCPRPKSVVAVCTYLVYLFMILICLFANDTVIFALVCSRKASVAVACRVYAAA